MKKNAAAAAVLSALLLLNPIKGFAADDSAGGVSTGSAAQPAPSEQMLHDFGEYVQKTMREWNIPGMAVGIVQGDSLIYAQGFGVKTLGRDDAVNPDTIFQIGSTTKAFTAALTAMLVDEGKFKWDDKVVDYLPEFMLYDPWVTREFQVLDLMAQRSGLPSHAGDPLYLLGYDRTYIKKVIRCIQPVTSRNIPTSAVNVLFLYAADLIEKISGKSWEQSIEERIFKPLEMTNSSVDRQSFENAKNAASPHVKVNGLMTPLKKGWPYFSWSYTAGPAGSINSNVTDMAKWLSFQMNNGSFKDKRLVSEKNMIFTHSPKIPVVSSADGGNLFYAAGWVYQENVPHPIIWHDGEVTGMKSMIAFVPEAKTGIVILSNSTTEMPELLAMRFFDQYFGKKLNDYSGDMLTEIQKVEQQSKSQEPVPPKSPRAPLPLEKYAGEYFNKIYGVSKISLADGQLVLSMGNKGVLQMTLGHWDGDTFVLYGTLHSKDEKNGFITFDVDMYGNVQDLTINTLNEKFQKTAM